MKAINFYISILIVFLVSACDTVLEDDLGVGDFPDQLTVNGALQVGGRSAVFVSKTTSILGKGEITSVENAHVTLQSGNDIYELEHEAFGNYSLPEELSPETTYKLKVDVPGESSAWAETRTPKKAEVLNYEVIDTLYVWKGGNALSFAEWTIQDDPDTENYYEFLLYQFDSLGQPLPLQLRSNDLSIENSPGADVFGGDADDFIRKLLVKDQLFNGKKFTLKVEFLKAFQDQQVMVHFKSVNEDYFDYLIGHVRTMEAQDEAFTEPLNVPSNVNGGLGFLGGYYMEEGLR